SSYSLITGARSSSGSRRPWTITYPSRWKCWTWSGCSPLLAVVPVIVMVLLAVAHPRPVQRIAVVGRVGVEAVVLYSLVHGVGAVGDGDRSHRDLVREQVLDLEVDRLAFGAVDRGQTLVQQVVHLLVLVEPAIDAALDGEP